MIHKVPKWEKARNGWYLDFLKSVNEEELIIIYNPSL
jgi:hypothetical protein